MPTPEESHGGGRHSIHSSPGSVVTGPTPRSRVKQRNRRAAKACLSCRARKVRCDVVSQSPKSCTNCRLDQVECAVPETKRRVISANLAGSNASTDLHPRARLPSKAKFQILSRRSNAISLDTELPLILSPDSSMTGGFGSSEVPDLIPGHVLVRDGVLTSISDTMRLSLPPEAIGGTTTSTLETAMGPYSLNSTESIHCFQGQDAFFADFEEFTQMLSDENLSQREPTVFSSGQPTAVPKLHVPEFYSYHAHSKQNGYASPMPWVAGWCGHQLGQTAPVKMTHTSLASGTIESLLRDYFQFVNPIFPVVSEWDVYRLTHPEEIDAGERIPPMSLALFNAIMFAASAFATIETARGAGFPNIRAMREAFHSRARVLYEAGCEQDLLNQIRVCLLLSQSRKYPDGMFENERWIVRAQKLLQQADMPQFASQAPLQRENSSRWKLISCCCVIRAQRVIIGTHRNALVTSQPTKVPSITAADLEEDLRFPWFLEIAAKRKLAQVFLASIHLQQLFDPLCQITLRREPEPGSSQRDTSSFIPFRRSVIGALEEVESTLMEWRARHSEVLLVNWDATGKSGGASPPCLAVAAANMDMTYEYCVSYLHQISLDFERSSITPWAARMRESSREALQASAASTTKILRDLLDHDAVKFLPFSAITMLFIPLTINSIFLKSSVRNSTRSVHDLSVCFQALETLAERHEIADFFWELNKACTMLVHENLAKNNLLRTPRVCTDNKEDRAISPCDGQDKVPLPQTDTYSSVLRLLKQSLVLGTVQWDMVTS